MKRPVFAANWKMNMGPADARAFLKSFLSRYQAREDRTLLFFPPAVTIAAVVDGLTERDDIAVGAQNIHWEEKGAFTGETSAALAKSAGATFALVGHSERRHVFGETSEESGRKCAAALAAGLGAVLCVGEKLDERESGSARKVVEDQLRSGLRNVTAKDAGNLLIAYEPVWAIGTGKTATADDAAEIHAHLRTVLDSLPAGKGANPPILYGGSVSRDNVRSLLDAPGVDGVLVGGASLDPEGWAHIVQA